MAEIKYKRCFAFGCSYTQYIWPTLSDLIGCNFAEFYNLGMSGSDNTHALNRLIDAHNTFNLNPDTDLVIFGVTGHGRFTYWDRHNDWVGQGEYDFHTEKNTKKVFVNKFLSYNEYSPVWAVYRSVNAIRNFKFFLSALKIPHTIYPAIDNAQFCLEDVYKKERKHFDENCITACESIYNLFDIQMSLDEYMMSTKQFHTKTFFQKENRYETHPTTNIHYHYLKKFFPEYDTEKVRDIVKEFDHTEYDCIDTLQELMAKKFCLLYRKDVNIDMSLFLEKSSTPIGWVKKFKDSNI